MSKSARMISGRGALATLTIAILGGMAPTSGSAATTYAAATGSNANACTAASAPCLTISAALAKAVSGGGFARVVVLGPGVFNETVTASSTSGSEIVGDGNGFVGIQPPAGGVGIIVEVGTGSMRVGNLQILGNANSGSVGIRVLTGGNVDVENVEIHGFSSAAINSEVSTAPFASMSVTNSVIADGGCLVIHPVSGSNLSLLVENSRIRNCSSIGVKVDGSATAGGGGATAILRNSSIEAAQIGLEVTTSSNSSYAMASLENSISENTVDGVVAKGAGSIVYLNKSSVMNNHTGIINAGGQVNSYGNNSLDQNFSPNSGAVTPVTLK